MKIYQFSTQNIETLSKDAGFDGTPFKVGESLSQSRYPALDNVIMPAYVTLNTKEETDTVPIKTTMSNNTMSKTTATIGTSETPEQRMQRLHDESSKQVFAEMLESSTVLSDEDSQYDEHGKLKPVEDTDEDSEVINAMIADAAAGKKKPKS